jgi:hypothetical protein
MALRNLTIVGLLYFVVCEDSAWIEIHWNSICLMAQSHMTFTLHLGACDHTTWFLEVFWDGLGHFFWALTISWSWLLACVRSGPQTCLANLHQLNPLRCVWVLFGLFSMLSLVENMVEKNRNGKQLRFFVAMFSTSANFSHLDSHNKTCVALANLWWSVSLKKWIKIQCSPNSIMVIGSAWLLISFNWIQCLPKCVHYWVQSN